MTVYNATPRHATPRHATPRPVSALKFQPEPEHQESPLKHKLRLTLKQYPFIRYPFIKIVRPAFGAIRRAKVWARGFCLKHEPLRSWTIRRKGYRECPISTVYDYCREHDGIIRVYDDSCQYPARPLCRTREEFEENAFAEPVMRPAWYIYVSKIRDTVIFGGEDLMYAGGHLLSDRKPQNNKYYISGNIPEIGEETALVRVPESPEIIEKGIDLVKMWSGNLYHFSFEAIARLQLVEAIEEYRTWPLILDEEAVRNKWNFQLLEMMNIYEHTVIVVQGGKSYLVKEMLYPSFLNWSEGRNAYAVRMHKMAADYVREHIMNAHKPSRNYKNVYMARGDNKRLLNEDEVIQCLSRYGIEAIYPRIDNYIQILDAFMTADNIIGVTGTNLISQTVSKPGANVYMITPFEYQHEPQAFSITDNSPATLHFIPADIFKLGPVLNQTTFTVDIAKIEALAQKLTR